MQSGIGESGQWCFTRASRMTPPPSNVAVDADQFAALLRRALVFNHIDDAVILTTRRGVILDWNRGAERLFGWKCDEVVGRSPALYHAGDDAAARSAAMFGAVERLGRWNGWIDAICKDGRLVRLDGVAVPLIDDADELVGVLLVHAELRDEPAVPLGIHAVDKLTDDRFLLRTLIDAVPDPIFCKDREGRYLLHNLADAQMFGSGGAGQIGKTVFEVPGLEKHAEIYHEDDQRVIATGKPVVNREEPFQRPDGTRGWFLTSKFPLRDDGGTIIGIVGMARDITQVKEATEELQQTRKRLVDHVENSPLAVIEWRPDFRVERWTGQAEALFGWKAEEVEGRHFSEWAFVHPDDAARVAESSARLSDGREQRNTLQNRNFTKSGRVVFCAWQNSVLRDQSGKPVSILSLIQDVSDRVLAEQATRKAALERQALERKLQEAQKLESLGVLAGGIAHDFNNLLTGVLGNASLARMELPEHSPIQMYLEQVEVAATRAADLCRQMLAYSGKGRFVVRNLDINALIEDTARLLQVSISKRAVLKFELAPDLPVVLGDPTQLQQVVMNLVINASEAVGAKSGFISLTTGLTRADSAYLAGTFYAPDLPEGDYVFLEVADNGGGMPPEVLSRIFDPFFTTKFTGRGLGLAAVLGIVRGHKGALKVFSEEAWGTTFKILLPCAEGVADETELAPRTPGHWRGEGRVLVVDDEETVRVTTARMLESFGFTTQLAENGRAGLETFVEGNGGNGGFAFVMLDLTMPHMDGEEAYREMVAHRADVRVLLMSGYNEQEAIARFAGKGLAGFIQKPFTLPALREKLQMILG